MIVIWGVEISILGDKGRREECVGLTEDSILRRGVIGRGCIKIPSNSCTVDRVSKG